MLSKGNVVRQLTKGMENKTEKDRRKNRTLIKKFLKTVYFMAKQKWAVKNNFEDVINFLSDIGVEDIKLHIEDVPQNAIYTSTTSAEQFLKAIGDYLKRTACDRCTGSGRILCSCRRKHGHRRPFTGDSIYSFCECYFTQSSRKVFGGG